MKNSTIILDYGKMSDVNLESRGETIEFALTGNPNFPTTEPTVAQMTAFRLDFRDKMNRADSGDRTVVEEKNQAKKAFAAALRQLGLDVLKQSNGDRAKQLSSGFLLASDAESGRLLGPIRDYRLQEGNNPGEIRSMVRGVANAVAYSHEYTLEEPTEKTVWISCISSLREHVFTGLPSGTRVYCRIRAIGRKGQEIISQVLVRVVQ